MCTPASPPRLSETAWEYAFWDFQGPKIPKCVLPPPPRLSETQIAWKYASGSTHFGTFKGPKYLLPPASQRSRLLGSTHFGTFKGPKYLNVYSRLPRLSETQIAWEYAFWDFQGSKIPKCVLPPPPRLSETQIAWEYAFWDFPVPKILKCVLPPAPFRAPDCLAARIL